MSPSTMGLRWMIALMEVAQIAVAAVPRSLPVHTPSHDNHGLNSHQYHYFYHYSPGNVTVTSTVTPAPPQPTCTDASGPLIGRATGFVRGSPIVVSGTTTGSADDCRSYCSNVADEILAFASAGTFSPDSFAFTTATGNCLCYRPVVCNYFTSDPAGDTIAGDRRA
ncbi:MAG: hypothetical protein Q9203_001826 [Teloschistes exilis]